MSVSEKILRHIKPGWLWITAFLFVFGLSGATYLLGFETANKNWFPADQITDLKIAIKRVISPGKQAGVTERRRIETAYFDLNTTKIKLPFDDPGAGGALTTLRDELLILNRFGDLYHLQGEFPQKLPIAPPDNNFAEYVRFAESDDSGMVHNVDNIRYNDVLFIESATSGSLLLSYTEWNPSQKCYRTAVARLAIPISEQPLTEFRADSDDWQVIFRTRPCLPLKRIMRAIEGQMAGGRLAAVDENQVLLSSGDYHWDGVYAPKALPQAADNDYGKVVQINIHDGSASHMSIGQRNIQGIVVTRGGKVWTTEHGPRGGDELNLIEAGSNYGWPIVTLGTKYNRLPWPDSDLGRHNGFIAPAFAWVPSIGVSSLIEIIGFDPAWDGDLMIASLRGRSLLRVRTVEGHVQTVEPIVVGERIRYVQQFGTHQLALWTDSEHLMLLSKAPESPTTALISSSIVSMDLSSSRSESLKTAVTSCQECHSFEPDSNDGAPSLANLYGRRVASTDYMFYSPALSSYGGSWTGERLTAYLQEPSREAPGTSMPRPGLTSETVADLVSLFEKLSEPE